ncbi:response regulator transcription factor [Sulfurospirillum sp. 1612]|uniref:response regulator transcription factor n=1 Tax=Sulfurospirillum sp. 1612 TaxID=3094835 RepID=UPI002F93E552
MNRLIAQKLKTITLLYAEDEDNIRENIVSTLRYYVKEVIEAKDGKEAWRLYTEKKPDIIMSDILMPLMSGLELVEKIRKIDHDTPIVLITAHTEKHYLLSAVTLHLEQYLVKPVTLPDIMAALATCVKKISLHHAMRYDLPKEYSYDIDHKLLSYNGKAIKMNKKEISFFELLLCNTQRVVTYEELQEFVWGDSVMTDNALRSVVASLRKKLPKDIIVNLSGIGYKLENI